MPEPTTKPRLKSGQKTQTNATDKFIGSRIRDAREKAGMSQSDLSDRIGVSRQQIVKYESGHDRMRASMLCAIAIELAVEINGLIPEDVRDLDAVDVETPISDVLRNWMGANSLTRQAAADTLYADKRDHKKVIDGILDGTRGSSVDGLIRRVIQLLPRVDLIDESNV